MGSFSGTFTASEQKSKILTLLPGQSVSYSITTAALTGAIIFEKTDKVDAGFFAVDTMTATDTGNYINQTKKNEYVRLRVSSISGGQTVDYNISEDTSESALDIINPATGLYEFRFTESGGEFRRQILLGESPSSNLHAATKLYVDNSISGLLHNSLTSIQGGTTSEYYHLTSAQHTSVGTMVTVGLDALTTQEVDQLENIGANVISATNWGYLAGMNQAIATSNTPTFSALNLSGDLVTTVNTNNGNPGYYLGASSAERLEIRSVYASGTTSLDYAYFVTKTASGTSNRGLFRFNVDEVDILDIDDSGINMSSGKSITVNAGSITNLNATNDGNPQYNQGSSASERLEIRSVYASGTTSLNYVYFVSKTASATANRGLYRFAVDEAEILDIDDTGLNITIGTLRVAGTQVVGARGSAVANVSGGTVIDAEARTAINSLLARLRTHGLIAP